MATLAAAEKTLSYRDVRQRQIANKLLKKKKASFEAVTGFGKTRVALLGLMALDRAKAIKTVLVIVPTTNLKKQWESKLQQFSFDWKVLVINTARKQPSLKADVVILDEAHNYASEQSLTIFKLINPEYLWCLTATMERSDQRHLLIYKQAPLADSVAMWEAEKYGFVSSYELYHLALTLEGQDRIDYRNIDDSLERSFKYFHRSWDAAMSVLRYPNIAKSSAAALGLETGFLIGQAKNVMRATNERKTFLATHPIKLRVAKELTDRLDAKIITFAANVSGVKKLTEMMYGDAQSYHSQQKKPVRQKILEEFNKPNSKIRILNTAKALDEGADVHGLSVAIILSGTSSKRQNIQRMGRVLRAAPGKKAIVVDMYFEHTQEDKWLKKRSFGLKGTLVKDPSLIKID